MPTKRYCDCYDNYSYSYTKASVLWPNLIRFWFLCGFYVACDGNCLMVKTVLGWFYFLSNVVDSGFIFTRYITFKRLKYGMLYEQNILYYISNINGYYCIFLIIIKYHRYHGRLRGLTGSALDHRSPSPEFESLSRT